MTQSTWRQFIKIEDRDRRNNPITHNVVLYEPALKDQPPKDVEFIVFGLKDEKIKGLTTYFLDWVGSGMWNESNESYYIETNRKDISLIILNELTVNMRWSVLPYAAKY